MSKSQARTNTTNEETKPQAAEEHHARPAAAEGQDVQETAEAGRVAELERQVAELRDRNLRLMADLRNLQQRFEREQAEHRKYANETFARDLLVILDDLERTMQSARTAESVAAVAEGVRIVYEHFLELLRKHGVRPIEMSDKRHFDPDLHEAVMQQPSEEHPAGTIIQELARGYQMHDRVIRPSKVIVSSGSPGGSEAGSQEGDEAKGDPS